MANTRAQQTTLISTNLPDNTTKSITPLKVRQVENAGVSAYAFVDDDNDFTGVNNHTKEVRWHKGVDLASATALALGVTGNYHHVTGSTEIETLSTKQHGTRMVLYFEGAPNLKHSSNLLLGGQDIQMVAGSSAEFISEGGGVWRLIQYNKSGIYRTLDRTAWDALVAANGLVAGWRYLVTGAYTFDYIGNRSIIVIADSVNTVQTTGWVIIGDFLVPYTVDSSLSNPGTFLECFSTMALTGADALAYTGSCNWRFANGLTIYLTDGSSYFQASVQGSDNTQIIFDNVKALDPSAPAFSPGDLGTFDPNTDTFTPNNGTYTPTLSDTDFTVENINYVRNGEYVNITGLLSYSGASTGNKTLNISLPIPSAFTTIRQAWGQVTGRSGTATFNQGFVDSNGSGGVDLIVSNPASFSAISFNLTYIIL